MLKGRVVVTKEDILRQFSEEDLFKYYLPNFKEVDKLFFSDERKETRPSCSVGRLSGDGRLVFKDFGSTDRAVDIWGYVQRKFNCNYPQALEKIAGDLNIRPKVTLISNNQHKDIYVPQKRIHQSDTVIRIKRRQWSKLDTSYWYDRYFLSEELVRSYNISPVSDIWINLNHFTTDVLAYSYDYYYHNGLLLRKIYQPMASKERKWLSNINTTVVQGIANIPKTAPLLIITKSLKDVMVLRLLGFVAVAPNNESSWLPEAVWEKFTTRYSNIVILFDNDASGIRNAQLFATHFNLPFITVPVEPDVKDVSDYLAKHHDVQLTKNMIEETLRNAGLKF